MRVVPGVVLAVVAACSFQGGAAIDAGGSGGDGGGPRADAGVDAGPNDPDASVDALPSVVDAAAPASCPPSYEMLGSSRYRFDTRSFTWDQALASCAADQALAVGKYTHLAVIGGEAERSLVSARTGTKKWIGLTDRGPDEDVWRWVTIEDTGTYPPDSGGPWKSGAPNPSNADSDDCVWMEASTGDFEDRDCNGPTEPFVCECDDFGPTLLP